MSSVRLAVYAPPMVRFARAYYDGLSPRPFIASRTASVPEPTQPESPPDSPPSPQPDASPDWAQAMQRVAQDRCRNSFMRIYDYYAPRVATYLRQQGASEAQAEDWSQDALLTLWRKAHLFQPGKAQLSTWLFRIARNLMIDQLRRERGVAYDTEEAIPDEIGEDAAANAADEQELHRKLSELPVEQADLIYKNYFQGKSHSEIAQESGQALGSVKSRLRAALKNLRRAFDAELET